MIRRLAAALIAILLLPGVAGAAPGGIQWYGTWAAGAREAARSGRPILLVSGAPQCHHVPGMW